MKIAIHLTKGYYSERWVSYCESKGIDYKLVDCYRSDIIDQLSDCDALMWHFSHQSAKASKFAIQLLFAVEASGKKVYPDFNTVWHFDDKVAQKYLLEAMDLPGPPAYAFYSKKDALAWAAETTYPKVFKLRNGSSSDNVKLVKSYGQARKLIRKSFGRGFKLYKPWNSLMERIRKYRHGITTFNSVLNGIVRLFWTTDYNRVTGREKGYIYFQDFVPGMDHDIRVIVVGGNAFAAKRMVRKNDFRASGSGYGYFEKELFDEKFIKAGIEISDKLKTQSLVCDFVSLDGKPVTVEISYASVAYPYDNCPGYWDREMNWHEGAFNPYGWMVDNILESIESE
jgi:glutathione synthase/RimK-type ligase-like ATP-grasp enzyme